MKCGKHGTRRSWRQSEKDIIEKINTERNITLETQVSFKDRKKGVGGAKSSKPDGYHGGPPPLSVEIKNYKHENYSSMKSKLKKQYEERVKNLPAKTTQEAHIDIRGQFVSEEIQKQMEKDLIEIGYTLVKFY